jgi:hypothetical protein
VFGKKKNKLQLFAAEVVADYQGDDWQHDGTQNSQQKLGRLGNLIPVTQINVSR